MDVILIAIQALHVAATMLLAGGLMFGFYARGAILPSEALPPSLLRGGALVALLSGLAWLALEGGEMGSGWTDTISPGTIGAVLTETAFGRVWLWRMVLSFAIVATSWLPPRTGRDRVLCVMAVLSLGSVALIGHSVMRTGMHRLAQIANQTCHLVAGGIWLGGLPALGLALLRLKHESEADGVLRRFSMVGLIAVSVLVLTGMVNSALQLGSVSGIQTPYGRVLMVKLCLVLVMLGLAALNRLILLPRVSSMNGSAGALGAIRTAILAEIILGVSVIAIASVMGSQQPPFVH